METTEASCLSGNKQIAPINLQQVFGVWAIISLKYYKNLLQILWRLHYKGHITKCFRKKLIKSKLSFQQQKFKVQLWPIITKVEKKNIHRTSSAKYRIVFTKGRKLWKLLNLNRQPWVSEPPLAFPKPFLWLPKLSEQCHNANWQFLILLLFFPEMKP